MEARFAHKELDWNKRVKDLERDKKKVIREFESLKE